MMPAGAPRTVSLPPEEMIQLGKEMVNWVKENKPLHLSHWYLLEKNILHSTFRDCYRKCKEFYPYYEQAMAIIGERYLSCDGIDKGIANRWQRVYFKDLRDEEDARTKYDAETKANANIREAKEMNLVELMKETSKGNIKQID